MVMGALRLPTVFTGAESAASAAECLCDVAPDLAEAGVAELWALIAVARIANAASTAAAQSARETQPRMKRELIAELNCSS